MTPEPSTWRSSRPIAELDQANLPSAPYPYANILGDTRNRSRRRLQWFNWLAAVALLLAILAAISEAL